MSPPSKSRTRSQQDRQNSQELLSIYGSLLTPKQHAMTSGYCVEGKSFSQIAREQGVSRQAVHEAVRGVQRLLRYYEEKLGLHSSPRGTETAGPPAEPAPAPVPDSVTEALDRLEALRNKVTGKGIIYTPDWIVHEINNTIRVLEEKTSYTASAPESRGGVKRKPARKEVKARS